MFNALGNIFSIKPRQAEHTDTRQGIQRHDPEFERRRRSKESQEESDFTQDNATVSVEALRLFLENFVKNANEDGSEHVTPTTDSFMEEEPKDPLDFKIQTEMTLGDNARADKQSSTAAHAASRYQNTAETTEKNTVLLETTDSAEGPPLDLSAADIRTIHILIDDLKSLSEAKIEYLNIERANSFLESLINAVNKVKTTL